MGDNISKFKLIPYTVAIKRKRSKKDYFKLDAIGEKKIDFFDLFIDFLEDKEHRVLKEIQKTLSIYKKDVDGREIYGVIKSGEYNILADFYDINEGELKEEARTLSDSEVYPFFFLFSIPRNSEKGILILQSFGIYAIKSVLERAINSFLDEDKDSNKYEHRELEKYEEFKNITVEIRPLISEKLLDQLKTANAVYNIKLIRHKVPVNSARRLWNAKKGMKQLIGNPEEIEEIHTFKVKSKKKNLNKENFIDALSSVKKKYGEIFEEKYDEIRIVVDINGAEQSLIFGTENKYREIFPLDDKKVVLENGFPEYNYLKKTAEGYLKYLNR